MFDFENFQGVHKEWCGLPISVRFFTVFCTPYKVVKIEHPFGMLQSNIQVLQHLVGFFYSKTCFAGTASYEHFFHYFDKIMGKKHELCTFKPKFTHTMCIQAKICTYYVHLSQNLHIHYVHLSRNLHIHYVQISPAFQNCVLVSHSSGRTAATHIKIIIINLGRRQQRRKSPLGSSSPYGRPEKTQRQRHKWSKRS